MLKIFVIVFLSIFVLSFRISFNMVIFFNFFNRRIKRLVHYSSSTLDVLRMSLPHVIRSLSLVIASVRSVSVISINSSDVISGFPLAMFVSVI